jgi:hypothetical protein
MRVSVTGAAGFTGSPIVCELRDAGHQVPGLALPGGAASPLAAAGAGARRGTADEPGSHLAAAVYGMVFEGMSAGVYLVLEWTLREGRTEPRCRRTGAGRPASGTFQASRRSRRSSAPRSSTRCWRSACPGRLPFTTCSSRRRSTPGAGAAPGRARADELASVALVDGRAGRATRFAAVSARGMQRSARFGRGIVNRPDFAGSQVR